MTLRYLKAMKAMKAMKALHVAVYRYRYCYACRHLPIQYRWMNIS